MLPEKCNAMQKSRNYPHCKRKISLSIELTVSAVHSFTECLNEEKELVLGGNNVYLFNEL